MAKKKQITIKEETEIFIAEIRKHYYLPSDESAIHIALRNEAYRCNKKLAEVKSEQITLRGKYKRLVKPRLLKDVPTFTEEKLQKDIDEGNFTSMARKLNGTLFIKDDTTYVTYFVHSLRNGEVESTEKTVPVDNLRPDTRQFYPRESDREEIIKILENKSEEDLDEDIEE